MKKINKILIAIDDAQVSEKIAMAGFQLGTQLGAEIGLVSVVDTTLLMTEGAITPSELADSIANDYDNHQKVLIDNIFKGEQIKKFVLKGKPFKEILDVADSWEADLIVMGTHGRTGLSHLIMGSVAELVVRHSKKPLFIYPSRQ